MGATRGWRGGLGEGGAAGVAARRSAVEMPSVGLRLVGLSMLSVLLSLASAGGGASSGAAAGGRWRKRSALGSQKAARAHGATTNASRR